MVLSASLDGPKNGNKSAQVYPEHPSTRGMGLKSTTCHLSNLINGRIEGNILINKRCLAHMNKVLSAQDNKCESTQKLHLWSTHPL